MPGHIGWTAASRQGVAFAVSRAAGGCGMGDAPPLAGVLETALYVDDMGRARGFYETALGLSPMFADERLTAYPVGGRSALLVFLRGSTRATVHLPGGTIPPHDGHGPVHCALAVAAADLPRW